MAYSAGSIVVLKSGGQAMTVVSSSDEEVEVIWFNEVGELFRQAVPAIAIELVPDEDTEEEDQDEEEDDDDEEMTAEEEDEPKKKKKKKEYAD